MTTDKDAQKWYVQAMTACFDPNEKMADSDFLKLFAAAMCIPNYKKYKKGAPRRQPRQIWEDQVDLLSACAQAVNQAQVPDTTVKQRATHLADELIRNTPLYSVKNDYCKKGRHYKPERYLDLYLFPFENQAESTAEAIFQDVLAYYECILTRLYAGREDELEGHLGQIKQLLAEMEADCTIPACASTQEEAAWCLHALLLLSAAQNARADCRLLKQILLGIEPGSTLSIICLDNVTMTVNQYHILCAAAMRADPDLTELYAIYETLDWIRKRVDFQLDNSARGLVETFIQILKSFYGRKIAAAQDDWLNPDHTNEAKEAQRLAAECTKWIT